MADLEHWPEQNFGEVEREFLYALAIRRTADLSELIKQQESKSSILFGVSVLIAGAGGWAGHLGLGSVPVPLLTLLALVASGAALVLALCAFSIRDYSTGEDVRMLSTNAGATRTELRDASLEVLTDAYDSLLAAAIAKGGWLEKQFQATAIQGLLVAALLATM